MRNDFCAIDFETACGCKASACAVALVRVRNHAITDTFSSLIRPPEGMEIASFNYGIHGISNDDVREAPTFGELWPRIAEFVGEDYLVAHSAAFDRGVLRAAMDHYGIEDDIPLFECTVIHSRKRWPFLRNHKLDTVSEYLGIGLRHHQALSDALACAKIYIEAGR